VSESVGGRRVSRLPVDPRLAALLLLLPLTFLASRSCGDTRHQISQNEAIAIAKGEITYRPDGANVRFVRRGIPSRTYWAVSLWQRAADGGHTNVTVVVVDAETGEVTQVNRNTSP
jgi:hypothetical protein